MKEHIKAPVRKWLAAATLILVLTLLFSGCTETERPTATTVPTEAPVANTTAAPAGPESTAPVETAQPDPEETGSLPDTEATEAPEETPEPDVKNAYLNRTDISFFGVGESFLLSVQGIPAGTEVVWSSDDEQIAAVDETGRVTAVGPGTTKIRAQIGEEKRSCWIRCQFTAPTGEAAPSLNRTDISFFGIGEHFTLAVENLPEDTEVIWSSEDVHVATVDENGLVYAVGPGTIRVAAQVGDATLYCWVRCQFEAAPPPRSSVSDGVWKVRLYQDRISALGSSPADGYKGEAELLDRIWVAQSELDRLESGTALDLTAFGLKVYRVKSCTFSESDGWYEVEVDGSSEMIFSKDDRGRWCLMSPNGDFELWVSGTAEFVYAGDVVCLDQMSAVLSGAGEPIRCAGLMDLFGRQPGFENMLPVVDLTVENGLVTQAFWYYQP